MAGSRPTAVVMCLADPASDPRPNRSIGWLRDHFTVRAIGYGDAPLLGVVRVPLPPVARSPWMRRLRVAADLKRGRYDARIWPATYRALAARERAHDPTLIVVHDLALLPLALAIRGSGRVFFDAREYYPRHFEDRWLWRFFFQAFARHLCTTYAPRVDVMVTVSRGLADAYRREYGVTCGVLPSYPRRADLAPVPVEAGRVRMIHHGSASRSRRIELMIEVLRHTDERFRLDLMLVGSDTGYGAGLRRRAREVPGVTFREPVPFDELVRETNGYDIGLYLLPPTSFNTRHALPNKFFEFVQARLMVAIGPSPEMAPFVRDRELGIVSPDFSPRAMAAALNRLSPAEIGRLKANAHRAAAHLNADVLRERFLRVAVDGAGVEVVS